jgi:hypothetical protein
LDEMDVKVAKQGKRYELQHELRLVKLKIQKARNELALASSGDILDFEELALELLNFEQAAAAYGAAVRELEALRQRLADLGD